MSTNALSAMSTLQNVLHICKIRCVVTQVGPSIYELEINFRDGVQRLCLDFSCAFVQRFVTDTWLRYCGSPFFSSRLRCFGGVVQPVATKLHAFPFNSQYALVHPVERFTTPRIVELTDGDENVTESSSDTPQNHQTEPIVEHPRSTRRAIALPYLNNEDGESAGVPKKRRRVTIASLLGEKEEYTCRNCFKRFNRKCNMLRHEDSVHGARIVFRCPICAAVYKHALHFADHMRAHDSHQYHCKDCDKRLSSRNALKAHMRAKCAPLKSESKSSKVAVCGSAQAARDMSAVNVPVHPQTGEMKPGIAAASSRRLRIPYDFKVKL